MRAQLIRILQQIIKWLAPLDPKAEKARELILQVEAKASGKDISGERKRVWVLNNLITAFPDAKIRDLSFLIEQVIQEM